MLHMTQLSGFNAASGKAALVGTFLDQKTTGATSSSINYTAMTLAGVAGQTCVVQISCRGAVTGSSVTVDGVTATFLVGRSNSSNRTELWMCDTTASATGTIAVTWSGTINRGGVAIWGLGGMASSYDTGSTAVDNGSVSLAVSAGGVVIGATCTTTAGPGIASWTNLTESFDVAMGTSAVNGYAGAMTTGYLTSQASVSFQCNCNTPSTAYASFAPF